MSAKVRMKTARNVLAATVALLALRAFGQFAVDWSTVDGGGGSSTGGVFSVTGTIGQPDAGTMSGGNFTLHGGFWGATAVVQSPGVPLLSITVTNQTVVLTWPAPATGYQLQEASELGTTNWFAVAASPQLNGGEKQVTLPVPVGNRFYRLHKP